MLKYVKAKIEDLPIIVALEKECFNQYDCFSANSILYQLKDPNNSIIIELIIYDNKTVGYASFLTRKNSSKIRLYSICIAPEYSGRQIGRRYLEMRLGELAEEFNEVSLEVRFSNIKAVNLYKSLGFTIKEQLPNYYPDGEDGYKLHKHL